MNTGTGLPWHHGGHEADERCACTWATLHGRTIFHPIPPSRLIGLGDMLVVITDGITEARPAPTDLFGEDGVRRFLSRRAYASPAEVADGLLGAAKRHAGGPLSDDVAIVALMFQGQPVDTFRE